MKWQSNVKALFEEILNSNSNMAILDKPLKITYSILREAATRAMELQDEKLIAIFCRLALYEEADPYSDNYDEKAVKEIVNRHF